MRRRPVLLALLLLAACGSYASARSSWATATAGDGLGLPLSVRLHGADIAPITTALALLLLAAVPAVLATRGVALRAVLVLVALAGVGLLLTGAAWTSGPDWAGADPAALLRLSGLPERYQLQDLRLSPWAGLLPLACGAAASAAAVLGWLSAGRAEGLPSRFDSPGAAADRPAPERSAWATLDAGEDPTL